MAAPNTPAPLGEADCPATPAVTELVLLLTPVRVAPPSTVPLIIAPGRSDMAYEAAVSDWRGLSTVYPPLPAGQRTAIPNQRA